MSWLLTVHHLSSALVAALCWWLSHDSAARRDKSGRLAALGYAVLASAVVVTDFGRITPSSATLLEGLFTTGKLALASLLAAIAMRGEPAEKR
jgi:hypothetical protein